MASVGFTLTEVLVVIAILAILAALGTVGVMRAIDTARQSRIKIEVDNLDAALKDYKAQFGSYPPCDMSMSNLPAIRSHVARRFPRYNLNHLAGDLAQTGLDPMNFRPDQALVFWLKGCSPDPTHPFVTLSGNQIEQGTTGPQVKLTPLFEFDPNRLVQYAPNTHPAYVPMGSKNNAPYVYFDGGTLTNFYQSGTPLSWNPIAVVADSNIVAAYVRDDIDDNQINLGPGNPPLGDTYLNMDSCQIIAPGLDGKYSSLTMTPMATQLTLYPEGKSNTGGLDPFYDDNVTNFSDRARLGDARP